MTICKYHMAKGCTNKACEFAHPIPKPAVCAHHAVGMCRYGDKCRNFHGPVAKPKAAGGGAARSGVLVVTPSHSGAARSGSALVMPRDASLVSGGTAHLLMAAGGGGGGSMSVSSMTTVTRTTVLSGGGADMKKPAHMVVEIVLSFDTTGSMYKFLSAVRDALAALIADLIAKAKKHGVTLRVGVIAHGDYCDKKTSYVIKYLPLLDVADAAAAAKLVEFVKGVGRTGGGDAPECYELALQKALTEMGWTHRSARVVVIVGDDVPHELGYTCDGFTNALDWRKTLAKLADAHVRIFAVQAGSNTRADAFWQRLADETRGKRLSVTNIATLKDLVLAAAVREMGAAAYEEVGAELRARGWSREVEVVYETIRTVTVTRA